MDKHEEKRVLIQIIGVLEALKYDAITIRESERYIFSPRMIKKLRDKECDCRILGILEECCELEDIESLIPQKLKKNIDSLKQRSLHVLDSYEILLSAWE